MPVAIPRPSSELKVDSHIAKPGPKSCALKSQDPRPTRRGRDVDVWLVSQGT